MTKGGAFPFFLPVSTISHNCQTVSIHTRSRENFWLTTRSVLTIQGKWVTLLKAQWSQNPDVYPHFTVRSALLAIYVNFLRGRSLQIGDMDHSIKIFGRKGDLLAKLSDETKFDCISTPCLLLT
jgi:WD repeat-containing protein 76